jgi:hypothetical protein
MQELMQNPETMKTRYESKKKEFDALPDEYPLVRLKKNTHRTIYD